MKNYTKHLRTIIDGELNQSNGPSASAAWTKLFSQAGKLGCVLFIGILVAVSSLSDVAAQAPNHVEITSIAPLQPGSADLLISWEGSIPPYKLQVKDDLTVGWRDATFHIYTHSYVVSNSLPGSFYRVRTIPDRTPPPSMRGFGPRQVDCDQVRFTWDAGSCRDPVCADNTGGSGLRGYRIYRDGALLMEIPFPTAVAIDTTVADSTTYSYWAVAVDVAGNESPRSGTRVVETPSCDTPPGLRVTLAWDANPEPDVEGYVLRYGLSSGNYTETLDVGNVTTDTVAELAAGTTYYFVVAAYNGDGLEGDASDEVSYSVP